MPNSMPNNTFMQHGSRSQHTPDANERLREQTWSVKLGVFADTWWPLFVIGFGLAFVLGIPTQ